MFWERVPDTGADKRETAFSVSVQFDAWDNKVSSVSRPKRTSKKVWSRKVERNEGAVEWVLRVAKSRNIVLNTSSIWKTM